jgi:hypothetical protein
MGRELQVIAVVAVGASSQPNGAMATFLPAASTPVAVSSMTLETSSLVGSSTSNLSEDNSFLGLHALLVAMTTDVIVSTRVWMRLLRVCAQIRPC